MRRLVLYYPGLPEESRIQLHNINNCGLTTPGLLKHVDNKHPEVLEVFQTDLTDVGMRLTTGRSRSRVQEECQAGHDVV